jgi:7-keto-8-aminopelargonate synthetase-like enzyme
VGNCESRLLSGNLAVYSELEHKLAVCKKKDAAVLFATGYMANLGVLSSLPQTAKYARIYGFTSSREYTYAYFSDELNHVSIREGIRMSGAARATYRHLDLKSS